MKANNKELKKDLEYLKKLVCLTTNFLHSDNTNLLSNIIVYLRNLRRHMTNSFYSSIVVGLLVGVTSSSFITIHTKDKFILFFVLIIALLAIYIIVKIFRRSELRVEEMENMMIKK